MKTKIDNLKAECVQITGIEWKYLEGPRQFKILSQARFKSYNVFRKAGYSLAFIGYIFGGRDHSTISHGLGKIRK